MEQVKSAATVLRRLVQQHVASKGERIIDLERAATAGSERPEPVLLLTDRALYAAQPDGKHWARLPLDEVRRVTVSTDRSGMMTRYSVVDHEGLLWFDMALPMPRPSFREHLEQLTARRSEPPRAVPATLPPVISLAKLASLASTASLVSAASLKPVRVTTRRVA